MNIQRINDVTSEIGFLLLTHGAEIHRVEDTICRIASAYGASADVFAIPASLVVTVRDNEGKSFTQTRRVYYRDLNLDSVDQLNSLARKICSETPEYEAIEQAISAIQNRPSYPVAFQRAMAAVGAGGFALLFGGTVYEAFAAAIIGIFVRIASVFMEQSGGGVLLSNIVGGCVSGCLSLLFAKLYPALDLDLLIISTLMLLVPGLAMTNSVRDLVAGDLVTGVMKATEASIIAIGIAIGIMLSLAVIRPILGV